MKIFNAISFFAAVVFVLVIQFPADAKIINVANGSYSAVSSAVASASPGDAVMIPAGTYTWTQQLVVKGVSLIGAGTNLTVIVDEIPRTGSGVPMFIVTTTTKLTEISQLQIAGGVVNTTYNYNGEISISGDAPSCWRIDHVFFNGDYGKNIVSYGDPYAVVDHCEFTMRGISVTVYSDGYGDTNWARSPSYGGTNMLYVESCLFTNIVGYPAATMDGDAGARVVFRDNVILNDFWANHGTESGQRYRSMRSYEIYNNNFTYTGAYPFTWAIQIRGGTGVIFNNTAKGYNNLAGMFYYRAGEAFVPWGGMTGNNTWDTNDGVLYLTGTNSGATGPNLTVSGANWQINQWVGYTVNDTNNGKFSIITSNSANTIMVYPSKDFGPMTFSNGNHFAIYRCEAGIDQTGRGSGDLLQGDGIPYGPMANMSIGGTNWPRQVSESLYCWNNTLNGATAGGESDYPNIKSGRDYINGTTKPGYTPLTYPHPLTFVTYTNTTSSGTTTNTGTGGTTTNTGTGTTTNTGTGGTTTNTGTGGTTTNTGTGGTTTNTGTGGTTTNTGTGGTSTNKGTGGTTTNTGTGGTTNTGGTNKLAPPSGLHVIP